MEFATNCLQNMAPNPTAHLNGSMTPPSYQLLTLGRLALVDAEGHEDRSLGTRRRKLALLALLAINRRPVSRDMLVDMFWGDQPEERARHSLSDALSHLRRAIGSEAITTRRAEVQLTGGGALSLDVNRFVALVEAGELAVAIDLYNGPFLDAVHVGGSPRWEQWVGQQRSRFSALFQEACKRECTRLAGLRDWSACERIAERWLHEEPLSPHAALHLLTSLAATDSPEDDLRAMAVYDRLVRQLQLDFDCTPDSRVTLAAHEIAERVRDAKAVNAFVSTAPDPLMASPAVTVALPQLTTADDAVQLKASIHASNRRRLRFAPLAAIAAGLVALVAVGLWKSSLFATSNFPSATSGGASGSMVTTAFPEARLEYDRAIDEIRIGGDRDKVVRLLEQAVSLDTTFVTAQRRLAQLLYGDEAKHAHVVELLTRASRHVAQVSDEERFLVLGEYHMHVTRDYARAAAALRNLLSIDRDNSAAWHRLGMLYQYVGDNRRAADAYREAVRLDVHGASGWGNLIDALYAIGDTPGAHSALDEMSRAVPGHPAVFWQSASLAASEGDFVRAEEQSRAYIAATRTDVHEQAIGQRLLARVLWSAGNFEQGDKAQQTAIDLDVKRADHAAALRERVLLAVAPVWQGRRSRVDQKTIEAALAAHPIARMERADRPYAELVVAYALSGDVERSRTTLRAWSDSVSPARREQDSSAYQVARGTLAIAEHRYSDAVRDLDRAPTSMCTLCGLRELGVAYEALGHADSAAIAYRRYLRTPTIWRVDVLDGLHRRWVSARIESARASDEVGSELLQADRR